MSLPRLLSLLVVCCSGIVACGTGPAYENYPALSLPDEQVAILNMEYIMEFKDEAGNYPLPGLIKRPDAARLPPGQYWIRVSDEGHRRHRQPYLRSVLSAQVELKAGHRYAVKYYTCWRFDWSEICRDRRMDYWLQMEDIGTGEVVAPQREVEWQQLHR